MKHKEIKIEPERVTKTSSRRINKKTGFKNTKQMTHHETWLKKTLNPILRKLFGVEIFSAISENKVIGYGIRKQLK